MKFLGVFLSSLFLSGCLHAWVLPVQKISLESQIPTEDWLLPPESKLFDWQKEGKTFAEVFYPESCDWVDLVRVVDGDTLVVETNTKIRMLGIDSPESVIPNTPPEPYGIEASQVLKDLLRDEHQVCLLSDPVGDKYDKYDRRLAYVFLEDGTDLNAMMIELGAAKGYFRFPLVRTDEFKKLHNAARKEYLGVWGIGK